MHQARLSLSAGGNRDRKAAYQADAMLDRGDLDGATVWRRIVAVINELQREEPAAGERRH